ERSAPLIASALAALLVFFGYHSSLPRELVYFGLGGLLVAAGLNLVAERRTAACCAPKATKPVLQSVLTCPQCGFRKEETMPTDSCQFFYECTNCHTLLRPKPGDCCVFCS